MKLLPMRLDQVQISEIKALVDSDIMLLPARLSRLTLAVAFRVATLPSFARRLWEKFA
jgi:hypothetical protein